MSAREAKDLGSRASTTRAQDGGGQGDPAAADLLTLAQAEEYLGVARSWLCRLARERRIEWIQTALGRMYRRGSLDDYRAERRPAGRPVDPTSARQRGRAGRVVGTGKRRRNPS